jgi:hypothetical protein
MPLPKDEGAGAIKRAAGELQQAASGFLARTLDG